MPYQIDKKAKDGALVGHDISGEGFQRSVLKRIERKLVLINNPYSAASQTREMMERQIKTNADKQESMVSTENILFLLGGSFERSNDDLESIRRTFVNLLSKNDLIRIMQTKIICRCLMF